MASWLKLFHVLSIVLWIGPIFGAWWMYLRAHYQRKTELMPWVMKGVHDILVVEHVGFVLVIITGIAQLVYYRWWPAAGTWLWYKLWLFALIVVPFEIIDIWLSHYLLRRVLDTQSLTPEFSKILSWHHTWSFRVGPLVALVVLGVFTLSIVKTL